MYVPQYRQHGRIGQVCTCWWSPELDAVCSWFLL